MRPSCSRCLAAAILCGASVPIFAQQANAVGTARSATPAIVADAKLVVVPTVVYDKKGPVTTLTEKDFAISVDGRPQTIRYFDRDQDVPLTVGLLVDISRSQTGVIDEERKASETFLDSFVHSAGPAHPADEAFVLQFAHTAELLQDVTDSRSLLAAGLRQIGTQAPGSVDTDTSESTDTGNNSPNSGSNPNSYPNNGGYGPYGRRGGYPGGGSGSSGGGTEHRSDRATGGTVLYDSIFLASSDVLGKQKGRRVLIVLTDGVDRHSKESLTEAIEAAQRADTVVYAMYYKGRDDRGPYPYRGGYGGYGGYDPYGRYPPTTGGSTDPGTYRDPDGKKILQRICDETGGRMFEVKGKGAVGDIYRQIGDDLRAQYRLGFTPGFEAAGTGFHALQVTLTDPANRKLEIQARTGYYAGAPKDR